MTFTEACRICYGPAFTMPVMHKVTLRIGSRTRDFRMTTGQVNRTIERLVGGKPARRRGWLVVDGVVAAKFGGAK